MAHYFIDDGAEKRTYERSLSIDGREYRFLTSDGVFSKRAVDEGTVWLLTAAVSRIADGAKVADLGCGYGALGVVIAARNPLSRIYMFDINAKAVELANANASRNGVAERAVAAVGNGLSGLGVPVDCVVTNPPFRAGKQVVLRFFEESRAALVPGGALLAVLRKQQGAESYIKAIIEMYGNCEILLKKKGYVVVEAVKGA